MAIKGLSDRRRSPRLGKVHLGVKAKSAKTGNEYPQAVDYFVVKEDQSTLASAAKAFHSVYGEKPKALDIMFPTDNPEEFFPQFRRRYGSGSGLLCKGDGNFAEQVNTETGEFEEIECNPDECEWNAKKHCRPVGSLTFLLPKVPGTGVWQLDTSSYHSIVNMNSAIDFVRGFTELATGKKKIGLIPLTLCVRPKEVQIEVNGKVTKKTIFILDLMNENLRFEDIMRNSLKSPLQMLVPDIDMNEVPTDLYPASLINGGKGEEISRTTAEKKAIASETIDTETGEIINATATVTNTEQEEETKPEIDQTAKKVIDEAFDALKYPPAKRSALMTRYKDNLPGLVEHLQGLMPKKEEAKAAAATAAAKPEKTQQTAKPAAEKAAVKSIDEVIDEKFALIKDHFEYDAEKIDRIKARYANKKKDLIAALNTNIAKMEKELAERAAAEEEAAGQGLLDDEPETEQGGQIVEGELLASETAEEEAAGDNTTTPVEEEEACFF